MKKYLLILLSFLIYIPSANYLIQAWESSRLDSYDWIFYLLTIPAAAWSVYKNRCEKSDWKAVFIAVPALIAALLKNFHYVNALSIIGCAVFVWSTTFLLGGWRFAYCLLPCCVLLLLGTPSSSYRLAQLFSLSTAAAMMVKFLIAAGCFMWIYINKRFNKTAKCEAVLFIAAVILSFAAVLHANELYFSGKSRILNFPNHTGEFYGRELEPDANTKRFFATSKVNQYRYIADDQEISVLAVKCGNNVHEIHPASHCLRTSSWVVSEEKIHFVYPEFAVTEIKAAKGNNNILIWVWYSDDEFSTPGFLGFRRRFRPNGNYHTFQISVQIKNSTNSARKALRKFVAAMPQEKK